MIIQRKKQEVTRSIVKQKLMQKSIESLQQSKRSSDFIRFMNKEKRKLSISKFSSKFFHELFSSVQIWLLTPEVVSELLPMNDGMFDLVILMKLLRFMLKELCLQFPEVRNY